MALVKVSEQNGVASVVLNRPDVRNAFNPDMIREITDIFTGFAKRKDVRLVTLWGDGKAFCAGADLSWMKAMVNYSFDENREDSVRLSAMFESILHCPQPVLGVVHGAVFGGALGLVACCDYVIAEKETQFCFSEVKIGIVPAVISSFVMKKALPGLVRPFMISGQVFDAERASAMGLIHEIVPPEEGLDRVRELATQWLDAGPEASRETKKLLNELPELTEIEARDRTTRLISERRVSTEGQEGLKSFLEKRSPSWRDR